NKAAPTPGHIHPSPRYPRSVRSFLRRQRSESPDFSGLFSLPKSGHTLSKFHPPPDQLRSNHRWPVIFATHAQRIPVCKVIRDVSLIGKRNIRTSSYAAYVIAAIFLVSMWEQTNGFPTTVYYCEHHCIASDFTGGKHHRAVRSASNRAELPPLGP